MGADGGTIPKRCELVPKKKKSEKISKAVKNAHKWRTCQLSQAPLKKPIVADRLGRLYNKENVIEAILTKSLPQSCGHLRGRKDYVELNLCDNKDYKDTSAQGGDVYLDSNHTPFLCPVTALPMNGVHPFVFNCKCGCVVSEKAITEVKSDTCHVCGGPWIEEDVIVLYPDEELLKEYMTKLETKKEKKKKEEKKENGEEKKKASKRKEPSSFQNDPSKSEGFKKLFTTCEDAKKKPQGHWVTYNPLFY